MHALQLQILYENSAQHNSYPNRWVLLWILRHPDECQCHADINGVGQVDVEDLLLIISQWNLSGGTADINFDGIVNVSDLLIVIDNWGACE